MDKTSTQQTPLIDLAGCETSEITIGQLVGQVYEAAPPSDRSRMLEQLLRPLGVLALVAVANGIFARIRLREGLPQRQVRIEDTQAIQVPDIVALVERLQQFGAESIDGLAGVVAASPVLAGSAAAALLLAMLVRHAGARSEVADDLA